MIEILAGEDFERLDVFLADELEISRSRVQALIKNGNITSENKKKLKPSTKILQGQKFFADIPESENFTQLKPEPVNFEVIYEDDFIIVVNKPAGLVVHPAPGHWSGTLVNGLVFRYPDMLSMTNLLRPGIVHRLDAGTSGLMVVARNQKVLLTLQEAFKNRSVSKKYIALIHGRPSKNEGILSGPIDRDPDNFLKMAIIEGGRPSLTGYKVLWSIENFSLVGCRLFTGRTHQIRVHFSALGCPLVGDNLYGNDENFSRAAGKLRWENPDGGATRVFLHSWRLEFSHPVTKKFLSFCQKIPNDFITFIQDIK